AQHREREDHLAVLRLLVVAPQQIGDRPDKRGVILRRNARHPVAHPLPPGLAPQHRRTPLGHFRPHGPLARTSAQRRARSPSVARILRRILTSWPYLSVGARAKGVRVQDAPAPGGARWRTANRDLPSATTACTNSSERRPAAADTARSRRRRNDSSHT